VALISGGEGGALARHVANAPPAAAWIRLRSFDEIEGSTAAEAAAVVVEGSVAFALEALRGRGLMDAPVIAACAGAGAGEVIELFRAGASDCVIEPVDADEVLARVRAALARRRSPGIMFPREGSTIRVDGQPVQMRPTPRAILQHLVAAAGRWVTADEIIRDILGTHHRPNSSLIRVHVHGIRRALGRYGALLETDPLRARRYRWRG
jgi:DNA-binding response OmpR family regulator